MILHIRIALALAKASVFCRSTLPDANAQPGLGASHLDSLHPIPSSARDGSMPAPQVSTKAGEGQETSVSLSCTQFILDFPFELIFLR